MFMDGNKEQSVIDVSKARFNEAAICHSSCCSVSDTFEGMYSRLLWVTFLKK
jgi:hypothetical protein